MDDHFFVSSGYEYYAAARFAMHAQSSYICGNLFHHAVEMLLKADLAKNGTSLDKLKSIRHDLKKLWKLYKRNHWAVDLSRHDKTINELRKHESIRYPNESIGNMVVSLDWFGGEGVTPYRGTKSTKVFTVGVRHIDDLVADIIRTTGWNPQALAPMNPAAIEAIARYNEHARFLNQ